MDPDTQAPFNEGLPLDTSAISDTEIGQYAPKLMMPQDYTGGIPRPPGDVIDSSSKLIDDVSYNDELIMPENNYIKGDPVTHESSAPVIDLHPSLSDFGIVGSDSVDDKSTVNIGPVNLQQPVAKSDPNIESLEPKVHIPKILDEVSTNHSTNDPIENFGFHPTLATQIDFPDASQEMHNETYESEQLLESNAVENLQEERSIDKSDLNTAIIRSANQSSGPLEDHKEEKPSGLSNDATAIVNSKPDLNKLLDLEKEALQSPEPTGSGSPSFKSEEKQISHPKIDSRKEDKHDNFGDPIRSNIEGNYSLTTLGQTLMKNMPPFVLDLIHWRDLKISGIVFGAGFLTLLSLAYLSVISVFAYVLLSTITICALIRVVGFARHTFQHGPEGHPLKEYIEKDLSLPETRVQDVAQMAVKKLNCYVNCMRDLLLVQSYINSLKLAMLLWVLTYIGKWFNGLTLIILSYVGLFTLPKVYEMNKPLIDGYVDIISTHVSELKAKIMSAIPVGSKNAATAPGDDKKSQ